MRKTLITQKRRGLWARLAALLVVSLMTTAQMNAQKVNVSYVDVDGTTKTQVCTPVTDKMTGTWSAGWYVVNSNVTMTGASVTCLGAVHLILADGCSLNVTGVTKKAGINVSGDGNSLTIYGQTGGTGVLNAQGGSGAYEGAAGIGGGFKESGSYITINGGTVTATGGFNGAGIGGGSEGSGSNITINGGNVTATGGENGAGIGGGYCKSGSNITINGGTVTANGKNGGAGIGSGNRDSNQLNIFVSDNCFLKVGYDASSASVIAHTSTYDLARTLNGNAYVNSVAQKSVTYIDAFGVEQTVDAIPVTNSMTGTWSAGWYVVNSNVTMTGASVTCLGEVNLILADGCSLNVTGESNKAGINVSGENNSLTIYGQSEGTGTLTATGGNNAAGIGGGYYGADSNITINGGNVTATGGNNAAGIGGGYYGAGSNITINGGNVTATGGSDGAGIGGGSSGAGSYITINGGTVTATGSEYGAGIGGGSEGSGSNITINGGNVTATGGKYGAGIGGGNSESGFYITINGGTVIAIGGRDDGGLPSGIGSGSYNNSSSDIYVSANCILKAGDNASSASVIALTPTEDLAFTLAGKAYVNAEEHNPVTFEVTTETGLTEALTNVLPGDTIKLTADIDLTATMNVASGKNFKLDLNGHKLARASSVSPTTKFALINIAMNGTLKIIDSDGTSNTRYWVPDATTKQWVLQASQPTTGTEGVDYFTTTGGVITGGYNDGNGGAINNAGNLTITDGNITGNSASSYGGGIYDAGTLTITSGTISGNSASTSGGGIYDAGTLTVGGDAVIYNNTVGGNASNVYVNFGKIITISTETSLDGAKIGVTMKDATGTLATFAEAATADDAQYFTSDVNKYHVNYLEIYKSADGYLSLESHSWKYTAVANVLYAYCEKDGCPYYGKQTELTNAVTDTLVANDMNYSGQQHAGATLIDGGWTELGITAPTTINYSGVSPTTYDETTSTPANFGKYQATIGTDGATAAAPFVIRPQIYCTTADAVHGSVTIKNGNDEVILSESFVEPYENLTFTATPVEHWHFTDWTNGPVKAKITDNPLKKTMDLNIDHLVGNFAIDKHTVTAMPNVPAFGSVSIEKVQTKGGGTVSADFDYGSVVQLTATPTDETYTFLYWTKVSDTTEVISRDNKFKFTLEQDTTFKAVFVNEVAVNIYANPTGGGEVKIYDNKNGKYLTEEERQHIKYGTSVTIEATAFNESGFAFVGWFNKATGEYFSKTQKFTFDAKENLELEARFTDQVIWVRVKKGN